MPDGFEGCYLTGLTYPSCNLKIGKSLQRNVCKEGRRALQADQDAIARSGEGSFVCLGCIVGLERGEEASRAVVGGCSSQLLPLCGGESWAAWHLFGEQVHVETVGAFCDLDLF